MLVDGEIRVRRGTSLDWTSKNPILAPGEQGYETDTRKMKIGDGSSQWIHLEYLRGSDGSPVFGEEALQAHIASLTPHATYDDIPDLTLLFENGLL